MSTNNLVNYKKLNAQYRREIRSRKADSLFELTSKITPQSKPETIWNKIRKLCGLHKYPCY